VEKLSSILVVADCSGSDRTLLEKAIFLARKSGAQIHLFSCAAELAYALRHSYDAPDVAKAWHACAPEHVRYLKSLRADADAPDVHISVSVACSSPLYEAIVTKVREIRPDLVMKSPSGAHPLRRFTFDSNDWQLMRACPATLMLVREHHWDSPPRFGALLDVSEEETPRLAGTILHASEYLALTCRGDLDVIYSERSLDPAECGQHEATLDGLCREHRIGSDHLHLLGGDPEATLPDFAASQQYDAVLLGALTHRRSLAALMGTLTSKLIDALDCDFILIKRTDEQPQASAAVDREALDEASSTTRVVGGPAHSTGAL